MRPVLSRLPNLEQEEAPALTEVCPEQRDLHSASEGLVDPVESDPMRVMLDPTKVYIEGYAGLFQVVKIFLNSHIIRPSMRQSPDTL